MSSISLTQAGLTSLLVTIAGFIVAFVPSFAVYEKEIISIGSAAIALAFMITAAIHAHAAAKVQAAKIAVGKA